MKINNLSFSYDQHQILNNLTFDVKENEILGIIGESGAGKSTLLRLLAGLIPVQEGTISRTGQVGVIFQNFNLFPHLNVMDNLSLALKVNKILPSLEIKEKAQDLLADFGIADKADAYIDQLSGGEKQRVAITRALMLDPQILLIDEATSNLDPKRRDEFMRILSQLKNASMSIVLVSHDHNMMKEHSDRLIYLMDGKISQIANLN